MTALSKKTVFDELPAVPDQTGINAQLQVALASFNTKIIVLDDDPTGVQTVHDVSVYTNWTLDSIRAGFAESNRLFFILTNSRSFTADQTKAVHTEIAKNISAVAQETGQGFLIISRSDSTLRGHYPLETEVLKATIEADTPIRYDGEVLLPFFKEGGRFTIHNTHYVQMDDQLVPAGETEFAKDPTFGYQASDLPTWVEEKTAGRYQAANVTNIALADLRQPNIAKITEQLLQVHDFNKVVVNATEYSDVKVFAIALIQAMAQGKQFIFRTAAAITKVLGGVSDVPLLTKAQLVAPGVTTGGLVMVGSYVKKTTAQLDAVKTLPNVKFVEFDVNQDLDQEEKRVAVLVNTTIQAGQTVVVYTSRKQVTATDKEATLKLSVAISEAITQIVKDLTVQPKFIIAKGGITSSKIGTEGLGVTHALVAGQIKPGIPVWSTGSEAKFAKLPYVIFPGNVGAVTTLKEVVAELD